MKRLSIILASVLMCTAPLCAKTASELRIYINPGHGSYTGNDRPQNTYREVNGSRVTIKPESATDTTGFYESNTNLYKGFGMLEELISYGFSFDRSKGARNLTNNLVMSRVKSGPGDGSSSTTYNRNLSEVAAEAENNNFDMFLSIHSDAASANSTTNRPLGLYRGHDTPKAETGCALAYQKTSKAIITALWSHCTGIKHQNFSSTATSYIRGDWDFYGSHTTVNGYAGYLGVLKSGVVGGLYEGYCHTYGPSRHRALNFDVDRVEGIGYARGTAEYFGVSKSGKGLIYGIIRTQSQQLSDTYYVPRAGTNDVYMPINGATVTLMNSLGQVLQTKTTDNNYNGAFVFLNLDPGTYVINITKSGYTSYNKTVSVAANTNTYPEIFLTPGSGSSTEEPGVVAGTETYPDPANEAGIKAQSSYEFEQEYVDLQIAELAGHTIKRLIADGNYLYILGHNGTTPKVVVYDHTKKQVVSTPGTSGCTGNYYALSDIALTADKVLIGINKVDQRHSSLTSEVNVKIYKWSNNSSGLPTGNPIVWKNTNVAGNWNDGISAETMAYSGTTQNGYLIYSGVSNNSTSTIGWRNVYASVTAGMVGTPDRDTWNQNAQTITNPLYFASPWNEDRFIFNASSREGIELKGPATGGTAPTTYESMTSGTVNAKCFHTGMFRYGGKIYMVVHTYVSGTTDSKKIRLVDITNGFTSAAEVNCTGNVITQASAVGEVTAGTTVLDRNSKNEVIDARIALFAMRGDAQLTKLVMPKKEDPAIDDPDVEDPNYDGGVHLTEYAYGLSSTATSNVNEYTVNYNVTGDAVSATLVLTPTEAGYSQVERIELPTAEEGLNSYTFSVTDLPAHSYSWAVEIKSMSNQTGACAYEEDDSDASVGARGGVVVITDPNQPSFGYAAVTYGKNGGTDIYAPDRTRVHQKLFKGDSRFSSASGSSMFRGDQLDGKAVFVDWSDVGSGYWQLDLLNPSTITDIMAGTKDAKGAHIVNGSSIGGGSSSVAFHQVGNTVRMYTFAEDYPSGNQGPASNYVYRYDLDANHTISSAPVQRFDNLNGGSLLANTCVEIVATDKGIFCAQLRGVGNNSADVPGFVFADYNGNVLFNSSTLSELGNGCSGGIAINREQNLLAVKCYTSNIVLYNITWNGSTPVLTHKVTIPSIAGATFDHMKFDYAGNLFVYNGNTDTASSKLNGNFKIYAMPTENPVVSTPARSEFEIVRQDLPTTVGIAGAFNNWNATANVTADINDNCGEITINNWSNSKAGQEAGFKVVVSKNGTTSWYGASSVNAEDWTQTSTEGANMTLPANCEGKNIKFTIAADNGHFSYQILNPDPVVTVGVAGGFNGWSTTAHVTGDIVDNCGEITVERWTNYNGDGFKVIVTTNGNTEYYGASEVVEDGWTQTSTSGANMVLPANCEGKTVTFTIAADNGHFSYEVVDAEPDPDPVDFKDNITAMTEVWEFSEMKNNTNTYTWNVVSGGQYIRDIEFLNGKLYSSNNNALNTDKALYVVNPANGKLIQSLNVTGISGGRIVLGGLSSIGGQLIAANSANAGSPELKVYKWADDNAAPELWLSTNIPTEIANNATALGDQINTTGDLNNGYLWFSDAKYVVKYKVTNGVVSTTPEIITLAGGVNTMNGSADVCVLDNGMFWVVGKESMPKLYNPDGSLVGTLSFDMPYGAQLDKFKYGTSIASIPFGNHTYLALTGYLGTSNTLLNGTLAIVDVTEAMLGLGLSRASNIVGSLVDAYPKEGFGTTRNTQFQTAVTYQLTNNGTKLDVAGLVCLQGVNMLCYDGVGNTTSVDEINIEDDAKPVYYNLQGVRVDNPTKGIYIKVTGKNTQKVVIR